MLKQYQYDQDKNLTGLFVQSGNAILANNRYLYDGNGNRTHKKQLGGETLYHYDPLNQLQKVQYPGYTEELFYDKAGNRTKRIAQGMEEFYQYDPRNRLTAYTKNGATTLFRYDHAGNLLSDDKARYSYDAFNRTTQVETFDGNIQINRYDAEGLRHEMEENGKLVQFIFNQDREVIAEQDSLEITRYIRSSELIARNTDAVRTYYHYVSDEMGSTTHIVDEDGIILNHYTYDAWGNLTDQEEAIPNRFKFTGQQLDPVTQQYYLRARFYNPVIARFTQEDTYRGDGLNLYAYCQNNPVFYTDPSGNVCPEGTKDPLLHAPVPSPNQQQSTALVPYDSHFASEQRRLQGDIYQDAKNNWHDKQTGRFVSAPNSLLNHPIHPSAASPTPPSNGSTEFDLWLNSGNTDYKVYFGMTDDTALYTGITKQPIQSRLSQHNANGKGFDSLKPQYEGLTKNQARSIEQYFIENGPNQLNKINSISPNNKHYKDAIAWAKQYLKV